MSTFAPDPHECDAQERAASALASTLLCGRLWAGNLLVAASYALLGYMVSRFFTEYGLFPAPNWPPASIAIAATLLAGWRFAPGILVGSCVVNHVLFAPPVAVTAGISVTNVIGPLVAAWLIRRATENRLPFDRLADVGLFIVHGVALHAAITATGGALMTWAGGIHGAPEVPAVWLKWFLSDAGGALFFGPAVMLWWAQPGLPGERQDRFGCMALTVAMALLAAAVFFDLIFVTAGLAGLPYVLMPFLIWGTLRFSPREASVWVSMIALVATVGTLSGSGPFQLQSDINAVASIGLMVVAFSISVLLTGAVMQERRHDAAALASANADLEARIAERTDALRDELAERREAEQLLEIMRFALDRSSILFFLIDPAGRFHYVNEDAARLTGYDRAELLERSVFDLRPDFETEDWNRHWTRIRAGRVGPYESRLRTRDGEFIPVEVTPHYVRIAGQEYDFAFVQDIRERKKAQAQLAHYAAHDPLTGVLNRREWFTRARAEVSRAGRSAAPLSVLMIDLDEFKRINDAHGHDAGDRVLRVAVDSCRACMREYDLMGRFGGEEFVVLAPDTDRAAARSLAERLRCALEQTSVPLGGHVLQVTLSIGIGVWQPGEKSVETMLKRADEALYAAKRAGRNRVSG